jgi:hypothetical protein
MERTTGSASPSTSKNAGQLFFFFFLLGWLVHLLPPTVSLLAIVHQSSQTFIFCPSRVHRTESTGTNNSREIRGRANQRQAVQCN